MELTRISNGALSVVLSERGAEIQSVKDARGTERIWDGNPAFWDFHAPILFPICGGLKEYRYLLGGVSYPMPKHGFARTAIWTLESRTVDCASYILTEKNPGYPFDYALHARYALRENRLEITYRVENRDQKRLWFSIGSHEAYALPGGADGVSLVFDQPETFAHYELADGNLIKKQPVILAENTRSLVLKEDYFVKDGMQALVFPYLKSRGVELTDRNQRPLLRVDYKGMDAFLLWKKRGAGYLCIEPWCNAPDFVDTGMNIEEKKDCMWLEPGQSAEKTHTITFYDVE